MKKLFAVVTVLMLITVSATMAERIPFTEWLEQQTAVAEQPIVQDEPQVAEGTALVAVSEAEATEEPYGGTPEEAYGESTEEALPEFAQIGMGSQGIYVEKLQEKLNQLGIPAGKVDGRFGTMTEAALKTVQKALGWEETGVVETVDELNEIMGIEPGDGVNLAVGTSEEWSEWMTPEYNAEDRCFTVSTAYLGDKRVGEPYTCQVEIEFSGVTATQDIENNGFLFLAQGRVDEAWGELGASNVWNSLVKLYESPADGVYKYTITKKIRDINVNATSFELGFRCDYWASGQFRVRCVKVEKGMNATDWTPAP